MSAIVLLAALRTAHCVVTELFCSFVPQCFRYCLHFVL
nr:MAG TPA: hypothetical protein [Caudoviricetes sp.]